jgi:RNA-directed DNA polymerase
VDQAKPVARAQPAVGQADQPGKAKQGGAGGEAESLAAFAQPLKDNLAQSWHRMSSGRDLPPPVRAVERPKQHGGISILGMPTVGDSIAQRGAKEALEPLGAPRCHPDAYGSRPGQAALQAVEVPRQRCWRDDWWVADDSQRRCDAIAHALRLRAVTPHTAGTWGLLYLARGLKAPRPREAGSRRERPAGTPQGGVVRPVWANRCLPDVVDTWMARTFPRYPWARDAEDGVGPCGPEGEARHLRDALGTRFQACGRRLPPEQTRMHSCQDAARRGTYPETQGDGLGDPLRPRRATNRYGQGWLPCTPGVSNQAAQARRQPLHGWRLQLQPAQALEALSRMFHPVLRGWRHSYGRFDKAAMSPTLRPMNRAVGHWVRRQYKRLHRHRRRAKYWLGASAAAPPHM